MIILFFTLQLLLNKLRFQIHLQCLFLNPSYNWGTLVLYLSQYPKFSVEFSDSLVKLQYANIMLFILLPGNLAKLVQNVTMKGHSKDPSDEASNAFDGLSWTCCKSYPFVYTLEQSLEFSFSTIQRVHTFRLFFNSGGLGLYNILSCTYRI